MGSPPPDAKTFVTSDDLKKVQDWYTTNVKGSKVVMSDPKMGTMLLVGDPKTGTAVLLASSGGKTYIGMTSAANVK
jgi:beta-lactam-binding protein with PASTA domain